MSYIKGQITSNLTLSFYVFKNPLRDPATLNVSQTQLHTEARFSYSLRVSSPNALLLCCSHFLLPPGTK